MNTAIRFGAVVEFPRGRSPLSPFLVSVGEEFQKIAPHNWGCRTYVYDGTTYMVTGEHLQLLDAFKKAGGNYYPGEIKFLA